MKQWLDRVTGAVTMYKLVILLLSAIGAVALVLSLLGQLAYAPLDLLASALVAIAATSASSWLAAKIIRVEPHLDSSFITGLLIFFVMGPKLDAPGLVSIALAGVIASVSKYLIAVRRRHIFNPAAVGVFVVTLITFAGAPGFSYAKWWVGTPFLLIPVAIGAFLVLYRTQRLTMGVVFVIVALTSVVARYLLTGDSALLAVQNTLLSSPLIFFAGFMLSEPLTLPPRRWQQLAEAVVVALLFTVPFSVGLVSNTPQFALLVGNLLAFFFGQRRAIRMEYLGKSQIGPTTWELRFQPDRPVRFEPGQYMELTIPHRKADFRGSRRYFSISSAPNDDDPITFAITLPSKSSSFKRALLDLEPGATVHGTSVGGDFALPSDVNEPLLLVAGGIGITPFASQLAHATARGEKRDVVVAYATSNAGQLPYASQLAASGARVVLYGPRPDTLPAGWTYGGEGRVTGERLAEAIPDVAQRRVFVSGPPALVNDLRRALRSQGARRVHSDYFSGY
ncbi:MAG: oxidoreductase [Rhodoglobus sp.]|nr:oxidoreductase [Rhodoglobus sp.]